MAAAVAVSLTVVAAVRVVAAESSSPPPTEALESARSLVKLLWAIVLLAIIFLTGLLILRSMRRTRQRLSRPPAKPTECSDAWQMHRLPEDAGAAQDEEPSP